MVQGCDFTSSEEKFVGSSSPISPSSDERTTIWVAIPAVYRSNFGGRVLNDTLATLFDGISKSDKLRVVLVLGLADSDLIKRRLLVAEVCRRYQSLVSSGSIAMVATPMDYYPPQLTTNRCELSRIGTDSLRRTLWRSKQLLDSAFLMDYIGSNMRPNLEKDYLLKLEDDSPVNPAFQPWTTYLSNFLSSKMEKKNWSMLRLYDEYQDLVGATEMDSTVGLTAAFGLLFPFRVVSPMVEFMEARFDQMPVDWAIGAYIQENRDEGLPYQGPGVFVHRESTTTKQGVDDSVTPATLASAEITHWDQCRQGP